MTTVEAYNEATTSIAYVRGDEGDTARTKARLLVDHVTGVRYAHLMQPDKELTAEQAAALDVATEKVRQGCPIPYITGHCEFYGHDFLCDRRALIPRPETELLVDTAIAYVKGREQPLIADLGTGSGC